MTCIKITILVDSTLQRLLDFCGDHAAEHEIAFNCKKTIGVLFRPQNYK